MDWTYNEEQLRLEASLKQVAYSFIFGNLVNFLTKPCFRSKCKEVMLQSLLSQSKVSETEKITKVITTHPIDIEHMAHLKSNKGQEEEHGCGPSQFPKMKGISHLVRCLGLAGITGYLETPNVVSQ